MAKHFSFHLINLHLLIEELHYLHFYTKISYLGLLLYGILSYIMINQIITYSIKLKTFKQKKCIQKKLTMELKIPRLSPAHRSPPL